MKRVIATLLIICSFNICVKASEREFPRFTFGVEWGYVGTFQSGYRYIFFPPEGYRVDVRDNSFGLHSNADMYMHGGINLNRNWNISMYIGYAGVADFHKVVPASIRTTRFFGKNPLADRCFTFVDLGTGLCMKSPLQEIICGKIGGGYRLSLSKDTKLDLILSARMTYTHPQIVYDEMIIDHEMVRRNNAYVSAVSCGIGLTF